LDDYLSCLELQEDISSSANKLVYLLGLFLSL
jgi:hypothetical protein